MVKVRVQHPPEASVKIHQVLKVGYGPTVREQSETVTWSSGLSGARKVVLPGERAEAPPPRVQAQPIHAPARVQAQPIRAPPRVQAQTIRGDATYTESSGFKYCFREVRNGQVSFLTFIPKNTSIYSLAFYQQIFIIKSFGENPKLFELCVY